MANTLFDNMSGAAINSPFKLQRDKPLDLRSVVANYSDLALLVSGNGVYEGMPVWVTSDKKAYRYVDGNWIEDNNGIDKNYLYYGSVDIAPSDQSDFTFYIDTDDNVAYLEGYSGEGGDIVIPYEYVDNSVSYPVIRISARAFQNNTDITGVIIPIGVTWIDATAFSCCTSLTSIILPDSMTGNMGNGIFSDCTGLVKAVLPKDIWYISRNTFSGCTNLSNVRLPENVQEIYNNAFYGCTSLESINIPRTVTTFGTDVFDGDTLIICEQGSAAETYAIENGLEYKYDIVDPDEISINIPIASIDQLGGIKLYKKSVNGVYQNASGLNINAADGTVWVNTADNYGITRDSSGNIRINPATINEVIAGTDNNKPITPHTLNYALSQLEISGVADNSITKRHLVTALQDIYELAQNQQTYSESPLKIGEWIDGTPIWRQAFKIDFADMSEEEYNAMIADGNCLISPSIRSNDNEFCIPINSKAYLTGNFPSPALADVTFTPVTMQFSVEFCTITLDSESNKHIIQECGLPQYSARTGFGVYGWVEFATPQSNVVLGIDGGTSNSVDLNDADGGTAYSEESNGYNAGDAEE